jgi:hypothetical protein
MNIPDHFSENFLTVFRAKQFLDADPDPGSGIIFVPGSGMEKFGFGIREKHPGSATLLPGPEILTWPSPEPKHRE